MPSLVPNDFGKIAECIIIMLGEKNFEILKGYKAEVTKNLSVLPDSYPHHHSSVTLTITGLSNKGANNLYNSLIQMPQEEVTELLKKKGFHFTVSGKKGVS